MSRLIISSTMATMISTLDISELHKKYGGFQALNGVSFSVNAGEIVGLLGHNGAGKTTLIKCIMGAIQSYKGSVSLLGLDTRTSRDPLVYHCGFLLEPAFWGYMTAQDNLRLFARTCGVGDERVLDVLEIVSLKSAAKKKVSAFSFGMKQRLGLAQALLANPRLLVLDEPTVGLDPAGIHLLKDTLVDLSKSGVAILFSSHQLYEVTEICNRIVVINNGEVTYNGDLADISSAKHIILYATQDIHEEHSCIIISAVPDTIVQGNTITLYDARLVQPLFGIMNKLNIDIFDINISNNDALETLLTKG